MGGNKPPAPRNPSSPTPARRGKACAAQHGWGGAKGGEVIAVDPAYTSQRCSCCGHVDQDNRKTQSAFACMACGHAEHADVNAAKNILAAGHAAVWSERTTACGEAVRHGRRASAGRAASAKQEPTEETCHA